MTKQSDLDSINIIGIGASFFSAYAWDAAGNIYSVGQGTEGQLMNGASSDQDTTWQTVTALQGQTIYKIHGQGYSVLVHASGGIYVAGHGSVNGRLGLGNNNDQNTPVNNPTLSALSIYKISFGNYASYAITTDGKGYTWGGDSQNSIPSPLSGDQSTPVEASSITNLPLVLQNPSLDFDGYNKLSISGITPTSTTLTYGSNTYDIGTKTDIYIKDVGTYDIETKNATKFALRSNVVGTVNALEELPPLISWTNLGTTLASDNGGAYTFTASGSNYSQVSGSGNNYITNTGNEYLYVDFSALRSKDKPFRVDYEIYGSAWNYALSFGQLIGTSGTSSWDTQNDSIGLHGDLGIHIPNGGVVSTGITVSTYGSTTWVTISYRREANGNTVKLYINDVYITEITPSSGTHPTGFQDPESQLALFKHEWMSTNTEYTPSGTRIRNIKVWDVTDIQLPKLTFDGYNKLTLKGLDSGATSNVTFNGNTYSIGSATDIYIENAGTYDAEINSPNKLVFMSNVVSAVASTQKEYDKQDQILDAGTDAGYSNGDASQGGFGNSMDMSADGTRMIVGNVHYTDANGRVWLYHLENGSWVLKQTWDGGTQLGSQVAMNEAGTRAFAVHCGLRGE